MTRTIRFGTKKEFNLLTQMFRTPAKCIFRKGDLVKFSNIAKKRLNQRRVKGKIVGYSTKYEWCVRVQWIEGHPKPIKNVERYAWPFFDFADVEEG